MVLEGDLVASNKYYYILRLLKDGYGVITSFKIWKFSENGYWEDKWD